MVEQTYLSAFKAVANYLWSDIWRNVRSFRIGVLTVFLVVSFVTLLKSVVDVAPVVFLSIT